MAKRFSHKLTPDEEAYFKETLDHDSLDARLLFGQFLKKKGLVSESDIFNARMVQKQQNRLIGELARKKGWLSSDDVERILVFQEETNKRFGEVAVEHGYLEDIHVDELLDELENNYVFFGEALVSLGVITERTMIDNLQVFHRFHRGSQMDA